MQGHSNTKRIISIKRPSNCPWASLLINRCSHLSRDTWGRKLCHVVAMDAIAFYNRSIQFKMEKMKRELIKAYTCFRIPASMTDVKVGVVTGNWGCGAFNGNKQLKGESACLAQRAPNEAFPFSHHTTDRCIPGWTTACLPDISRPTFSHVVLSRLRVSGRRKGNSERSLPLPAEVFGFAQGSSSVRLHSSDTCCFSLLNVSTDSSFSLLRCLWC